MMLNFENTMDANLRITNAHAPGFVRRMELDYKNPRIATHEWRLDQCTEMGHEYAIIVTTKSTRRLITRPAETQWGPFRCDEVRVMLYGSLFHGDDTVMDLDAAIERDLPLRSRCFTISDEDRFAIDLAQTIARYREYVDLLMDVNYMIFPMGGHQ